LLDAGLSSRAPPVDAAKHFDTFAACSLLPHPIAVGSELIAISFITSHTEKYNKCTTETELISY
jgi:hypothetical protein